MYYENHPIKSNLKSKRIKWKEPYGPIAWCAMKEMREHNDTRKIYDVNPYIEVYQFRDNLYSLYVENADGMQDVWLHLIVGPEKAMLIDTGYGIGDTKALVDQLTDGKPLIVANTHNHCDHAYGNCRFEQVYCHEYDVPKLQAQNEHIWDYLFDENGDCIWLDFDKADLPQFKKYEIIGLKDGHVFNLGEDYEVELIHMGGHTPGMSGYLDRKNRIFFAGDDVSAQRVAVGGLKAPEGMLYGECATLPFFTSRLKVLADRLDEFDFIFPGHLILDLESHIILSMLATCEKILAEDYYQYTTVKRPPNMAPRLLYNTFVDDVGSRIGYTK